MFDEPTRNQDDLRTAQNPDVDPGLRPHPKTPGNGFRSPQTTEKIRVVRRKRNKVKRGSAPIYDVVDELVAAALARWIAVRQQIPTED